MVIKKIYWQGEYIDESGNLKYTIRSNFGKLTKNKFIKNLIETKH